MSAMRKNRAALVRQRRNEAGLTLKDAAGMAGIGIRFPSGLERGKPTLQLGLAIEAPSYLDSSFKVYSWGTLMIEPLCVH